MVHSPLKLGFACPTRVPAVSASTAMADHIDVFMVSSYLTRRIDHALRPIIAHRREWQQQSSAVPVDLRAETPDVQALAEQQALPVRRLQQGMDNGVTIGARVATVAVVPTSEAAPDPLANWNARRATADRVFQGAMGVTAAITVAWLYFTLTGAQSGSLFGSEKIDLPHLGQLLSGFLIMQVLWGWLWYGVKWLLLRTHCGLSRDEARASFTSRLNKPFDLQGLLRGRSERRIRIADMVGRRGRYVTIGMLGFWFLYATIAKDPQPGQLTIALQGNLFDALVFSWILLATYRSDNFLARLIWGAQGRIMDGTLARANCLLIGTLWSLFRFVMVPLGLQLGQVFPRHTYATVFAFIWISYLTADALSEIVGSLFGKQKLRVWGMGEVNRKSIAGTWACFLGSLALCLALVVSQGLPLPWVGLAFAVSISNTAFELFSPRGTDDFTMATANALVCWGFGALIY
jgi:hypothetical protein